MKAIKPILLLFLFVSFTTVKAQSVSDRELLNFAQAYLEMMKINLQAQKEMTDLIIAEGLALEEYHAIEDSKETELMPDIEEEKFTQFESLQPKIQKIQTKLEKDVEKEFKRRQLTKERYQQIADRVKQDYLLEAKLQKFVADLRASQ